MPSPQPPFASGSPAQQVLIPEAVHHSPLNSPRPYLTQQQLQQLELQRQHQQRFQEQMSAQDSLRLQLQHDQEQHRTPRINNGQHNRTTSSDESKLPSYFSYPPRPHSPTSSPSSPGHPSHASSTWGDKLQGLYKFPCSNFGKGMLLVTALEALLVIIMQVVIVVKYFQNLAPRRMGIDTADSLPPYLDPENLSRSIPAYMIVFVFALLFQFVFSFDAVRAQNTIELIGVVIFNFCCFAYSIFEISQIKTSLLDGGIGFFDPASKAEDLLNSIQPLLITIVVAIGVSQILVSWLAYQLFQEFGWKIYKKIGADPNMKRMYRAYQIYLVLIKVDFFFFVGFSIQFIYLTLTRREEDPEYWITIMVLPLTILILYIAVYAVRHENRLWMATFLLAMVCGVVYFVYKVVRMYVGPKIQNYKGVNRFLTLFASLCLITILATIANAVVCYRNFGRGLRAHHARESRDTPNATSSVPDRVLEID